MLIPPLPQRVTWALSLDNGVAHVTTTPDFTTVVVGRDAFLDAWAHSPDGDERRLARGEWRRWYADKRCRAAQLAFAVGAESPVRLPIAAVGRTLAATVAGWLSVPVMRDGIHLVEGTRRTIWLLGRGARVLPVRVQGPPELALSIEQLAGAPEALCRRFLLEPAAVSDKTRAVG